MIHNSADAINWAVDFLVHAGIATPGTADCLSEAADHITRTRYQITASVMYLLRLEGYTQCCNWLDEGQATAETRTKKTDSRHHEETNHTQLAFARDVKSLSGVMR